MNNLYNLLTPVLSNYEDCIENIGKEVVLLNVKGISRKLNKLGLRLVRNNSYSHKFRILPANENVFVGNRKHYTVTSVIDDFIHFAIVDDKLDFILEANSYSILIYFFENYLKHIIHMSEFYEYLDQELQNSIIYTKHLEALREVGIMA